MAERGVEAVAVHTTALLPDRLALNRPQTPPRGDGTREEFTGRVSPAATGASERDTRMHVRGLLRRNGYNTYASAVALTRGGSNLALHKRNWPLSRA